MRRLIINADDFGMTPGVNRAIVESHRTGIVTSATLMANEAATDEAIDFAAHLPSLSTGCHVVLVDGKPVSVLEKIPSLLTSSNGAAPQFRPGIAYLALAAVAGKVQSAEVMRETAAQIGRLQSRGIALSHVDCHMHSHILPVIARSVLSTASDHGILAVRNPFEPAWAVAATHKFSSSRSWSRSAQITILRALRTQFLELVQLHGLKTTDGTIGIAVTGLLNRQLLERLVVAMPEGTWELVTHPGYYDNELAQSGTELKQSRAVELELLTSPATTELLRKHGVELISYRAL